MCDALCKGDVVMYWFPKRNANKDGKVTITRMNERDLNAAIADLEKRGFELVKRGVYSEGNMASQQLRTDHLTANLKSRRTQLLDPIDTVRVYAVMQREAVDIGTGK